MAKKVIWTKKGGTVNVSTANNQTKPQTNAKASGSAKTPTTKKKKPVTIKPGEARLAKIKDGYLFVPVPRKQPKGGNAPKKQSNQGTGEHLYVLYVDGATNELRAIQTTHLYNPDGKRMFQLKQGVVHKVKFSCYETPSGVNKSYYFKDTQGNPIDLNNQAVRMVGRKLPKKQAQDIISLAQKRIK